jgi:hypothetical protein
MNHFIETLKKLRAAIREAEDANYEGQQLNGTRNLLKREELKEWDALLRQLNHFLAKNDTEYAIALEKSVKLPVKPYQVEK